MPVTETVGGREIVHSTTLMIPKGEKGRVAFDIGAWRVVFNVVFEQKPPAGGLGQAVPVPPTGVITEHNGEGILTLTNWDNPLGTASTVPWRVGKSNDGHVLGLLAVVHAIGDLRSVGLQFMTWKETQS